MTRFAKAVAIVAALSASAAMAQADPHAGHHPDNAPAQAAPAKPEAGAKTDGKGCAEMMRGKGQSQMGAAAKGKDGDKAVAGRMECMSRMRSAANDDKAPAGPKTK